MIINNNSQINFCGGYRFRSMPIEARTKIPEISKKWKQVFYDFENVGDVFLVTRDKINTKVVKFIKKNKLKFEYYPEISTQCGLDEEKPDLLSKLLKKSSQKPITTMTQLQKTISNQIKNKFEPLPPPEYVHNILKALCIDYENLSSKYTKRTYIIDNPEFKRKIHISPKYGDNTHYVLVEPYSSNEQSKFYSIDSSGNILKVYKTVEEIVDFYKSFKKTILK